MKLPSNAWIQFRTRENETYSYPVTILSIENGFMQLQWAKEAMKWYEEENDEMRKYKEPKTKIPAFEDAPENVEESWFINIDQVKSFRLVEQFKNLHYY